MNGCDKCKADKLFKAQQWLGRLDSVARYKANRYEVIREICKGVAVSM